MMDLKRRFASWFLLVSLVFGVIVPGTGTALASNGPTTYYVALNGDDGWSGTLDAPNAEGTDGPFATIDRARNVVRAQIAAEGMSTDITVYVRGGQYTRNSTLAFEQEDSGANGFDVVYRNYPGERPEFVYASPVTGWQQHSGDIYVANVGTKRFRSLFENGVPAVPARTPNDDYAAAMAAVPEDNYHTFEFDPADVPVLPAAEQSDLMISIWSGANDGAGRWQNQVCPLGGLIDYENSRISVQCRVSYSIGAGSAYYLSGALAFLDEPGEFYLNSQTGDLYYWKRSGGAIDDQVILAPNATRAIDIAESDASGQTVQHITIDGFELWGTDAVPDLNVALFSAAVKLQNAHYITIANNLIHNVGASGIGMYSFGHHNAITGNKVYNTGFHGIVTRAAGGQPTAPMHHLTIRNNDVENVATVIHYGSGIDVVGDDNVIAHNRIVDGPRFGIAFGGLRNVIQYNDIADAMNESQDGGAIYTRFNNTNGTAENGTLIDGNAVHDVNIVYDYGFGIYLDDESDAHTVSNNVVYDMQTVGNDGEGVLRGNFLLRGVGNRLFNNMAIDSGTERGTIYSINSNTQQGRNYFSMDQEVRNNVFFDAMGPGGAVYAGTWHEDRYAISNYNTLYNGSGEYGVSLNGLPGGANQTWDQWKTLYSNKFDNYSKTEDPQFVDRANKDFRLSYDSPARALGTQPIDFEKIGLTSDFRYADASEPLKQLFIKTDTTNSGESLVRLGSSDTSQLTVTARTINGGLVDDPAASGASVTYVAEDVTGANVVSVSNAGLVTALNAGLAEVTATVTRGGQSLSIPVYVAVDDAVQSMTLKSSYNIVTTGNAHQLHAEGVSTLGVPLHLTSEVAYSSSDPSVATVDANGLVTGVSDGAATITATIGSFTDSVALTVLSPENALDRVDVVIADRVLDVGQTTGVQVTATSESGTSIDLTGVSVSYQMGTTGIATLSDDSANPTLAATADGRSTLTASVTINGKTVTGSDQFVSYADRTDDLPESWKVSNYSYLDGAGQPIPYEAGFAKYDAATDTYRIESAAQNIYDARDSTTFAWQEVTHDPEETSVTMQARLIGLSDVVGSGPAPTAGIMIRDADSATSKHINFRTQEGGFSPLVWRTADGGGSSFKGASAGMNGELKLVREGDTFQAFYKTAGASTWTFVESVTIPMDDTIYVGLQAYSGNSAYPVAATFDNVSVTTAPLSLHAVEVEIDQPQLKPGESAQASVVGYSNEYGSVLSLDGAAITYASSDPSVATIDGSGVVAGIGEGVTTITATATLNGVTKSASAVVEVTAFQIAGVTLLHTATGVALNGSVQAVVEAKLPDGTFSELPVGATTAYASSNPSVAAVDANGVVTGVGYGVATISADVSYNGLIHHAQVTIIVNGGTLYSEGWENGVASRWKVSGTPSISTAQKRSGSSSMHIASAGNKVFDNTTIRTIHGVQEVWFYDDGATLQDVFINSDWVIVGFGPVYNRSFYVSKDLIKGQPTQVSAVPRSEGWHQVVYDYRTNVGQLDVYLDGVLVNHLDRLNGHDLLGLGDYLDTNATSINAYFDDIAIYQVDANVAVTGISLNKSETAVAVGGSDTLIASVTPSHATNRNVTWSSSDPSVATVDANGTVTGVAAGTAVITATTVSGGFTASSTVTVGVPVTGVSLDRNEVTIIQGLSDTLTATVTPADATNPAIGWSTSDPSVATVSSTGVVTAVGEGTAVITVATADGGFTATSVVTVPVGTIILDNASAAVVGAWTASTEQAGYFGSDYLVNGDSRGTDTVTWTPNITTAGEYEVYYWLPEGSKDVAPNARFTVIDSEGSKTYNVQEARSDGGEWVLLGTHQFEAGGAASVVVDNSVKKTVMADAIKFVLVP